MRYGDRLGQPNRVTGFHQAERNLQLAGVGGQPRDLPTIGTTRWCTRRGGPAPTPSRALGAPPLRYQSEISALKSAMAPRKSS